MKLFCIISDASGHLTAAATRAPDLLRRTIAAETGEASLLWCSVPPTGSSAEAMVLAFRMAEPKRPGESPAITVARLAWFAIIAPLVREAGRALRRKTRRRRLALLRFGRGGLFNGGRP